MTSSVLNTPRTPPFTPSHRPRQDQDPLRHRGPRPTTPGPDHAPHAVLPVPVDVHLPLPEGVRLVGALREAVRAHAARRYDLDGLSLRDLAREIGRSYGLAYNLVTEAGVAKQPAGGQPRY